MAASKEKSQYGKASDFCDDILEVCQPCTVEGKRLQSDRFCVECQEHLCAKCSTYHKALKATRNHLLVSIDDAKNATPAPTKDKCSFKCTWHKDKNLKYYCMPHSYLGCSVCMTMDHSQCQRKDYIPEVAEDIRRNDGFKKFDDKLKALETACKVSIADVQKNLKNIGSDERQLKGAIKEFRKKIDTELDKFEQDLTTQAKQTIIEETKKLNAMSKKLATSLSDVDTLRKQVDSLICSGKNCDTYVLMRKEEQHLDALNDEIVNTTKEKNFLRYEFRPNTDLLKLGALGKLSSSKESVSSVNATISSDTNDSSKTSVNVYSPNTDSSSKSKHIQPGSRVRNVNWRAVVEWCGGTVEHCDSSRCRWLVRWDKGYSDYNPTGVLEILYEQ